MQGWCASWQTNVPVYAHTVNPIITPMRIEFIFIIVYPDDWLGKSNHIWFRANSHFKSIRIATKWIHQYIVFRTRRRIVESNEMENYSIFTAFAFRIGINVQCEQSFMSEGWEGRHLKPNQMCKASFGSFNHISPAVNGYPLCMNAQKQFR